MKILKLEIQNTRGIRDQISLSPGGKNFLVWGPNGTGKSAVVDAVDFLLTGRIKRLTGQGTGSISLKDHGPHVDRKPEEAWVRASILLPGHDEPIEISRCFAKPTKLEQGATKNADLDPLIDIARRGQHILTRKEILSYINVEGSTRAREIQELLDLHNVEKTRKALVKVRNAFQNKYKAARDEVGRSEAGVEAALQLETFEEDGVLKAVNRHRSILDGDPDEEIDSASLKSGLKAPMFVKGSKHVNVSLFENNVTSLHNLLSESSQKTLAKNDKALRKIIREVAANLEIIRALEHLQLTKMGLDLLDDSGRCPLCDTPWEPDHLREHLEEKITHADLAATQQALIDTHSEAMINLIDVPLSNLESMTAVVSKIDELDDTREILKEWRDNLERFRRALAAPLQKYRELDISTDEITQAVAPDGTLDALDVALSIVKEKFPEATPQQTAWDTLTKLEVVLGNLERAQDNYARARLQYKRAEFLLRSYQEARDSVLNALYDQISDRFASLYRQLHSADEKDFVAKLEANEASVDFEVDFYGRGKHPPNALHSEGHQDSMGLCLYLALSERLTAGIIDLVILDDVVMSVDADHRRKFCSLLATEFPEKQFLITTHDRTWASQLKMEGVVTSRGVVEFFNWAIDTGPYINYEPNMWTAIEDALARNDITGAAGKLRKGSEEFYSSVCHALAAQVVFRMDGRWELGDLLPSAYSQYGKLLRQAKAAAQSWGREEAFERYKKLDSIAKQIYRRTQAEQWGINASIHYNAWTDLTSREFKTIVEAFQDMHSLFLCPNCSGLLRTTFVGKEPKSVACNCGNVNWHLVRK